jgi:hypothetical protein
MGISAGPFCLAAVDPFRPGQAHHITRLWASPAAPTSRGNSKAPPFCSPTVFSRSDTRDSELTFRSSITRPTDALVYASTATSRRQPQDSGSGWIRFSFPVGLFHPLQHAGLSQAHPQRVFELQFTAPETTPPGIVFWAPARREPYPYYGLME